MSPCVFNDCTNSSPQRSMKIFSKYSHNIIEEEAKNVIKEEMRGCGYSPRLARDLIGVRAHPLIVFLELFSKNFIKMYIIINVH